MNLRDVRVGIVGLGSIGRSHATRLLDSGVAVAGMDTDHSARERFGEAYGVDTYDDARELFAVVDAVVVATPNCHHAEYAVVALDADCPVLVEKPLADSLASAERIADAARWSAGFCMVGFNNRFANSVSVLKEFQRAGRFGDVRHVEANYIRRRGVPGIGSWFTDARAAGGGSLVDLGVHAIDLALCFLDFPEVVEVSAATRSTFGSREDYASIETWGRTDDSSEYDVDDSVSAFVRTADGATVSLEVAWATNRPADDTLLVRGTDAGACFDRANDTLTLYESGIAGADHLADTTVRTRQNDTLAAEQAAFLEAVARGEPPEYNTLEQGLAVQRVIDAIYRSAAAGRAVRLAPRTKSTVAGHAVHRPRTNETDGRKRQVSPLTNVPRIATAERPTERPSVSSTPAATASGTPTAASRSTDGGRPIDHRREADAVQPSRVEGGGEAESEAETS